MGVELGRPGRLAGGDDAGEHRLAPARIGQADDAAIGDAGMGGERGLDLLGVDVLAARADHVVDPPAQPEIAVGLDLDDVARIVPAAAQLLGRRLGPVEIAREGRIRARVDDQLALLPGPTASSGPPPRRTARVRE